MALALQRPGVSAPEAGGREAIELAAPIAGVRLWWVDLDAPALDETDAWLAPSERDRAVRFVFAQDGRRYRAAHAALRRLLHQHCGVPPQTEFVIGPHGKPALTGAAGPDFNLSHCGSRALMGIGTTGWIGVDIESLRTIDDLWTLAGQTLSADECDALRWTQPPNCAHAFLRGWTRKEACLKAVGSGLSIAPTSFEVGLDAQGRLVRVPTDRGPVHVFVQSLEPGLGLVAAVARVIRPPPHGAGLV